MWILFGALTLLNLYVAVSYARHGERGAVLLHVLCAVICGVNAYSLCEG